jgi:hypothetical protein
MKPRDRDYRSIAVTAIFLLMLTLLLRLGPVTITSAQPPDADPSTAPSASGSPAGVVVGVPFTPTESQVDREASARGLRDPAKLGDGSPATSLPLEHGRPITSDDPSGTSSPPTTTSDPPTDSPAPSPAPSPSPEPSPEPSPSDPPTPSPDPSESEDCDVVILDVCIDLDGSSNP